MTTSTITFKLHLAPGAIEKFSIDFKPSATDEFIDNLELKLGELGLNFDVVFWRNQKGNLISLAQKSHKMLWTARGSQKISLYVIADSSAENSSASSSGESGDELIVIDSAPEERGVRGRRRCGRRDRSRSRAFNRSRSRSHSRGHSRGPRGPRGGPGRCGRKRIFNLEQRLALLEAQSAKRSRPCFGRRARSASPQREGDREHLFGRGFGGFGGHGPHHHGFHGHHHMGPFGARGGHHHGFGGRGGHHHGFGGFGGHHHGFGGFGGRHHGFDPRTPFGGRFPKC